VRIPKCGWIYRIQQGKGKGKWCRRCWFSRFPINRVLLILVLERFEVEGFEDGNDPAVLPVVEVVEPLPVAAEGGPAAARRSAAAAAASPTPPLVDVRNYSTQDQSEAGLSG
jgi:hypothetical protein